MFFSLTKLVVSVDPYMPPRRTGVHNETKGEGSTTKGEMHKANGRPILNDVAPYSQLSSPYQDKLEVIQNKVLKTTNECHKKPATSHFSAETEVLNLILQCFQQFYSSTLQYSHPRNFSVIHI